MTAAKRPKASDDHSYEVHEYGLDLLSNEIYLFGNDQLVNTTFDPDGKFEEPGVEFTMANRYIKNQRLCQQAHPGKSILVHLKTCGGDWTEGIAIYNVVKACPENIVMLNYTHARSMSSLIFLAADKRVMMPDSYFMFHLGTVDFSGTGKQYETDYVEYQKTRRRMIDIYVDAMEHGSMKRRTRQSREKWLRDKMDRKEDVFLQPEEAIELGFADEIFDYDWEKLKVVK